MGRVNRIALAALAAIMPVALAAQATAPTTAPATASSPVTSGTAAGAAPAPQIVPATSTTAASPAAAASPSVATPTPAATARTPVFEAPTPGIGQPDGRITIQDQVTEIGREGLWMHDIVLMPVITIISLLVLALLLWIIWRYRRSANPVPSRTSHNTVLEVIWTLAPVLILLAIAVPSIKLLAAQYNPPKPDLTVKVIGHQWYWSYQYPDNGDFEVVSNILKEKDAVKPGERFRTDADGPRLLAVDEHMVVPAGATVKVITTSDDVIHSFAMPAFWMKMDAVPGRLNETWFKVDRPGLYFGQCSELCGARHAFMPIAIEVVPPADFARWITAKGGTMKGAAKPTADATATSPVSSPTAGAASVTAAAPTTGAGALPPASATENVTIAAKPAVQAATTNR